MASPLPNEILLFILSDVLRSYVHSLVLLPSHFHCWHGHYTLRSVSRHFKAVADSIWGSSVGSSEIGQREFARMRVALQTERYEPEDLSSSPLASAYAAYVDGLIREPKSRGLQGSGGQRHLYEPGISLLNLTLDFNQSVRPREMSYALGEAVLQQAYLWLAEITVKYRQGMLYMAANVGKLNGDTETLSFFVQFASEYASKGDAKVGGFIHLNHIVALEDAIYQLAYQLDDASGQTESVAVMYKRLLGATATVGQLWLDKYEAHQLRNRALHLAARYGARTPAPRKHNSRGTETYFMIGRTRVVPHRL